MGSGKQSKQMASNAVAPVVAPVTLSQPTTQCAPTPIGNRSLAKLFRSARNSGPAPQGLAISSPSDPAELEADRIAAEVMRMPDDAIPVRIGSSSQALHRKCAACKDEDESLHRSATGDSPGTAPPIVHQVLSQPGTPLPESTRNYFEPRLGADLSSVRIHTDSQAARSANAVQAKAYTVGNSIAFADGQYAPQNEGGKGLLAHELAHVVLHAGAEVARRKPQADEATPAIGPPSFDPEIVDVAGMTNEGHLTECARVDAWLASNSLSSNADFTAYKRLRERLKAERTVRIAAGHIWLSDPGPVPNAFYQLSPGAKGRTNIVGVSAERARGAPFSVPQPIMTSRQLEAFLVARGIPQIDEATYRRSFARPLALGLHDVPLGKNEPLPLPHGKAATAAEPLVARLYYPEMTALPENFPAYDLVGGGDRSFSLETRREKGKSITIVNETIDGGHYVSVRMIQPGNASPDQIRAAVSQKVKSMVDLPSRRNPRDPVPVAPNTYYRVEKPAPEKVTVHILLSPEDASRVPELQRVANEHLATIDYGPGGLPAPLEVRVTALEPGAAKPIPLGPKAGIGLGAGTGGLIAIVLAGGEMVFDAKDHPDWARELSAQGGVGILAGGTQAAVEQAVVAGAGRYVPGAGAKLIGTVGRGAGAGVVSAGLEVYDMYQDDREHSTAEQIVRPARAAAFGIASAEAEVAAGAVATSAVAVILGSAGTGAAAGSVAPGVGTAIGFIVGLGVGIGTYYLLDKTLPGGRDDWGHN